MASGAQAARVVCGLLYRFYLRGEGSEADAADDAVPPQDTHASMVAVQHQAHDVPGLAELVELVGLEDFGTFEGCVGSEL
jgi:hypothetical protein